MIYLSYRRYAVRRIDGSFIASPLDGDDLELRSENIDHVLAAIDDIWNALDGKKKPWVRAMISRGEPRFDLDAPDVAEQFRKKTHPCGSSKALSGEALLVTLILATIVAMALEVFAMPAEPMIAFTGAVATAALSFGSRHAVLLSVLSAVSYNFFIHPPAFSFDPPTWSEAVYLCFNIIVALGLPTAVKLARRAGSHQRLA